MFDSYEWDYFVGFFREFARVRLTGNWTFSKKKKRSKKGEEEGISRLTSGFWDMFFGEGGLWCEMLFDLITFGWMKKTGIFAQK